MNQSDELTAFYQDYLAWIEAGAIETMNRDSYLRGVGLCGNLRYFCMRHEYYGSFANIELTDQFDKAGLSTRYPFNKDNHDYTDEMYKDSCFINPKRLQWVKDHAK